MSSQAFSYFGVSIISSVRDTVSQLFSELEIDSRCGKHIVYLCLVFKCPSEQG